MDELWNSFGEVFFIICSWPMAHMDDCSAMTASARCDAAATARRPFRDGQPVADRKSSVCVISCREPRTCPHWQRTFASQHKDHRYYDLINDTIHPEFEYLYFVLRDVRGEIRAIQPLFVIDQDILAGARPYLRHLIDVIHHVTLGRKAGKPMSPKFTLRACRQAARLVCSSRPSRPRAAHRPMFI